MNILKLLKSLNKKIINIMKIGIYFSFLFCICASLILLTYNFFSEPLLYHIGISLFKSGLFFIASFIICGFAFNKITYEV